MSLTRSTSLNPCTTLRTQVSRREHGSWTVAKRALNGAQYGACFPTCLAARQDGRVASDNLCHLKGLVPSAYALHTCLRRFDPHHLPTLFTKCILYHLHQRCNLVSCNAPNVAGPQCQQSIVVGSELDS